MIDAEGNAYTYYPEELDRGFHNAAEARGLLEDSSVWVRTLAETARERMGCRAFRRFFAFTCMHSIPPNRQALFDHFIDELCPQHHNENLDQQRERAYQHLEYIFRQWDSTCTANGLVGPANYDARYVEIQLVQEPSGEYVGDDPDADRPRDSWRRLADRNRLRFNRGQRIAFERIIASIEGNIEQKLFRLKGEGGTGMRD